MRRVLTIVICKKDPIMMKNKIQSVKICARVMLVQGELEYIYREPIISPANIKVQFEVYSNTELNFTSHIKNNENRQGNKADACEAGKKSIVAGGRNMMLGTSYMFATWPLLSLKV